MTDLDKQELNKQFKKKFKEGLDLSLELCDFLNKKDKGPLVDSFALMTLLHFLSKQHPEVFQAAKIYSERAMQR